MKLTPKSFMTRLGFALLACLLFTAIGCSQPSDSNVQTSRTPPLEPEEEVDTTTIASTNISLVVDELPFANVQSGKPFPIAFELSVIEAPLKGTLEIEVPGQPKMIVPIELLPPGSQHMIQLGIHDSTGAQMNMWGMGKSPSPPVITFAIHERGKVLLRQHYDLVTTTGGDHAWGELTSQIPLLLVAAPKLQTESPLNGITPTRFTDEVDAPDRGYYGGTTTPTPSAQTPLEAGPPVVIPLASGGYPVVGAYSAWDTLLIHGQDPREWSPAHMSALQDWVLDGGVLLLAPGAAVDWNPWAIVGLDDAPRIEGSARPMGTLAGLDTFLDIPLPPDNPVLERFNLPESMDPLVLASDGAPLLGWRRYGRGCIVAATFDLTHPSIRGWISAPRILQWMNDWGSCHRVNASAAPGSVAAGSMGGYNYNMSGYGYGGQAPTQELRQRISLGPLLYGRAVGLAKQIPVLLWFMVVYALALLALIVTIRSHRRWQPLGLVWGTACAGSLLLLPFMSKSPLVLVRSEVPIVSPAAPAQPYTGASLVANRGQFGATFAFPDDLLWRPAIGQPEAERRYDYGREAYEEKQPMEMRLTHPQRIENLDLPLNQRSFFVAQVAPRVIDPGFTVTTVDSQLDGLEVTIEKTDGEFTPNLVLIAAARGQQSLGALSHVGGMGQSWPHTLRLTQTNGVRDVVDHPERYSDIDSSYGYSGYYPQSTEDASYQTIGDMPQEFQEQRQALRNYAQPMRSWVNAVGGILVVLADIPEPDSGEQPQIRVWFDPTPIHDTQVAPILRFGHSRGVNLFHRGSKMQLQFDAGGYLMMHGEYALDRGELFIDGTTVAVRKMSLEQWSPTAGWVACPRLGAPESLDPPSWSLTIGGDQTGLRPLYRLRATEPVTVTQCLIPEIPSISGLPGA